MWPLKVAYRLTSWVLCKLGAHDWRYMNGVCCECGFHDPLWATRNEGFIEDRRL